MGKRNIKKVLALGVICLSLVFGQASVFAAGDMVQKAAPDQAHGVGVYFRYYVKKDGLEVRQKPGFIQPVIVIGVLNKGDYIDVEQEMGLWGYGNTSTGIKGWAFLLELE